ncbi:hypothetical protein GN244_ATG10914 [Phytophthora infestans]|uniref:Uncharacterized protein n=1 Tax=Phytophthora infestans TaxID=4787 RepID=A0A833T5A4_PHYIN|nr:hypothetical protein GN244_ATG10914 [Phytophthora infestans]KAF4142586.1 hypothetical protein GN958_ATG08246 [Phytophthora infestans]
MQTLLNFFSILPAPEWALEGVEKLHKSIEMCVEAVPVARFLSGFKQNLTGAARLRAERCWDQLASPTVPDGYSYSSDTRPVFTWVPTPYRHEGNRQERWRIVQVQDTENCFLIQNMAFGEYLYATFRGRPDREQSMVSLCRQDYRFDDDEKEMFTGS